MQNVKLLPNTTCVTHLHIENLEIGLTSAILSTVEARCVTDEIWD